MKEVLEFLKSIKNILLYQKLNENILKSDFLNCLLKILIRKHNVIAVTIYEEYSFILYLGMSSSYCS
jgi:hypothetical protein